MANFKEPTQAFEWKERDEHKFLLNNYLPQFTLMDFTHFDIRMAERCFVNPRYQGGEYLPPRQPQQIYFKFVTQDESNRNWNFASEEQTINIKGLGDHRVDQSRLRGSRRDIYDLVYMEDSKYIGGVVHSIWLEIVKGSRQGGEKEIAKEVSYQGLQINFDVQQRPGGIKTIVFEIVEVEEEGVQINSTSTCLAMVVDIHMQGLQHKSMLDVKDLIVPPSSHMHQSFHPYKILKNESILYKLHLRPLGFKNIRLLAPTDREIQEGLRSGRTSFLHIKSEEDYYDKRERVYGERQEIFERME